MQAFIGRAGRHGGHVRYGLSKFCVEKIHTRLRAGGRATSASGSRGRRGAGRPRREITAPLAPAAEARP
ncbi:hypothetical protein A8E97_04960 [Burkholderia cenocepacia]|uniref:Uncharacterized protein n=1 Tax=Burkholderia cenocepacia TaxID=95486 RepID=A0A427NPD2_9BURK|nr:hypothetical protein A8E88_04270 [Burkholderia cenocepacia]ONV88349.1 hypothetical protein A8E89_20215 [Burkholderia cenocepacia]ONW15026.1 hypothetical protein A8E90_19855 [Burkholderia cenocepacia]ONW15942.1 hypothetical protein A8E94_11150 [Burkholderia cenocepacia]ONW22581.1 hypothetical protein A8E90_07400 [Burkholderia cenocepacia]